MHVLLVVILYYKRIVSVKGKTDTNEKPFKQQKCMGGEQITNGFKDHLKGWINKGELIFWMDFQTAQRDE